MRSLSTGVVFIALLAACGSSDQSTEISPAVTGSVAGDIEATIDPMEAFLDDEGRLPLEAAEAVFAAAFSPLPGVTAGEIDGDLHESSTVLRVLLANREQLTAAQLIVIEEALGPVGAPLEDLLAGAGARAGIARDEILRDAAAHLRDAQAFFSAELGRGLPFSVRVAAYSENDGGVRRFPPGVLADATTREVDGRTVCSVRLNLTAVKPFLLRETAAHEMFHCFQYAIDDGRGPAWVIEGSAEWAGARFAGGSAVSIGWAERWITTPNRAITRRSYDAMGVFVIAEEAGVSMFSYINQLLDAPTIATMRSRVGPELDVQWGLSYAGQGDWGAAYSLSTTPFVGAGPQRQMIRARVNAGPAVFPLPPGDRSSGAQVYTLAAEGDVLVINGNGFGGLHFDNGRELRFSGSFIADYCLIPAGCVCPDGTDVGGGGRAITAAGSRSLFVGWGPSPDLTPQLEVQTLDQWCTGESALPSDGNPCMVGEWTSTSVTTPPINGSAPLQGGSGILALFRADSTFSVNFDNMTPLVGEIAEKLSVELTYSGATVGSWSVDGDGQYTGGGDSSGVRLKARLTGSVEQVILDSSLAELAGATVSTDTPPGTYRVADCSATALTLTTGAAGGKASMIFQRTG
ncbi:MAG: hypothetical protein HY826_00755 [Actinobacteria bacterium]|nr:hypothetical protein [Actinomycetota bacterium]